MGANSTTAGSGDEAPYGVILGASGINIKGMQIASNEKQGKALSVLAVDAPVTPEQVSQIQAGIRADLVRAIDIVEL